MKNLNNKSGFTLLEIVISISLAGVVLVSFSRTISTALDVRAFIEDSNQAANWGESVVNYLNTEQVELAKLVGKSQSEIIILLAELEEIFLNKQIEATVVEVKPYAENETIYPGLYQVNINVNYSSKNISNDFVISTILAEWNEINEAEAM